MKSADIIVPEVQKYVDDHAWTPYHKVKVMTSELGDNSGILGTRYNQCRSDQEHDIRHYIHHERTA